jgi:hypothetical protein
MQSASSQIQGQGRNKPSEIAPFQKTYPREGKKNPHLFSFEKRATFKKKVVVYLDG